MASFDSFQVYLKALLDMDVAVTASHTCLEVAGCLTDDLMLGIQPVVKNNFFDFAERRIVTMDY